MISLSSLILSSVFVFAPLASAGLSKCLLVEVSDACRPKEIPMDKKVISTLERNGFSVSAFKQVETYIGRFVVEAKKDTEIYETEIPAGTLLEFMSYNHVFDLRFPKDWIFNGVKLKRYTFVSFWINSSHPRLRLNEFTLANDTSVNGIKYPKGMTLTTHWEKGQTKSITPKTTFEFEGVRLVGGSKVWFKNCKPSEEANGHWKSSAEDMGNKDCPGLWDGQKKKTPKKSDAKAK